MASINNHLKKIIKRSGRKTKILSKSNIKVNRNYGNRIKIKRDERIRKRAEYLSTLPKNPIKRFIYRLHPKRLLGFVWSRHGISVIFKFVGVGVAVSMVAVLAIFAYYRKDLPKNITDLKTCSQGASTTYYDRTGNTLLWTSSGDVECYPVKLDAISPYLKNAVITAEDKDFYKHGGFSMSGVLRAGIKDLKGGSTQGGSTITQQFVKNSLLTHERTLSRKIKELILSIELERTYSKDQIINAYLNEISFGSVYNGAEAAARGYFNKSAKDLTLDESAMLAAIIPMPTFYSPYGKNTDKLLLRQQYVLDSMVREGYISKDEAKAAKQVKVLDKLVASRSKYKNIIAPHFVLEVQEQLEKEFGATAIMKAGFKVITTLDLRLQKLAEDAITSNMYKIERDGGDNAAMVSIDVATGQVLALVGSRSFSYPGFGELNVATTPRSPGSSFKPYDYASLMTQSKSWGAGSILYDLRTDFGRGWRPKDYDSREPGAMSMRYALGGSRNIPAIKAMYIAGIQNTIDLAKKMGVVHGTSCEPNCGLSAAIGDGSEIRLDEHVNGFATFSRMGKYKPAAYYLKIENVRGKTLKEWKDTPGEQVLDPEVAYIINNMLSDDSARYIRGSSRWNYKGITTALKTGTTNNEDNGWILMYSTKIATGVWIGNHENKTVRCGVYGCMEGKTGPIIAAFMPKAHEGIEGSGDKWPKPPGIKTVCINPTTGYATTSGGRCDIFPSWYQPRYPDSSKKAVIDSVSNKLATECTPLLAQVTITGGGIMSELPTSDPLYNNFFKPVQARYGGAGGAIPTDKDDIHTCDPADKPKVTLSGPTLAGPGQYKFIANVTQGKYPLKTVNFKIDGNILTGGSFEVTNNGSISFTYISSYDETKTMVVEVIDSVLYDATDQIEYNFTTAVNNLPLNRSTIGTLTSNQSHRKYR